MPSLPTEFLPDLVVDTTPQNFTEKALDLFAFQYHNNSFYRSYCDLLKVNLQAVDRLEKIPFLPIQFFKNREIKTTAFEAEAIFESSGTTGSINSKHFIKELAFYEKSFKKGFAHFYGDVNKLCIIGLLPSYLERKGSSLVYMVNDLINNSKNETSGFYLYDFEKLKETLIQNETKGQQTILIGVTYALIDFALQNNLHLQYTIIMETGGMKGRKEEMSRSQVHKILKEKLGVDKIHSEYGMTELLSQAYSTSDGIFETPPWMKILIRKEDDPFDITSAEHLKQAFNTGVINIIDLANVYSCAFIATDDTGKLYKENTFEITGRLESSDIRGCGLMIV